jgi:hypothetical protein
MYQPDSRLEANIPGIFFAFKLEKKLLIFMHQGKGLLVLFRGK